MLPIGTTVFLKEDSKYYSQSEGKSGTITSYNNSSDHIYNIKWENRRENCYRECDLKETNLTYEIY